MMFKPVSTSVSVFACLWLLPLLSGRSSTLHYYDDSIALFVAHHMTLQAAGEHDQE